MRSPASVNRITVTGDGSSEVGVGSSSANAELRTRCTPNKRPSPPRVAPPKIKPRLEMSFIPELDGWAGFRIQSYKSSHHRQIRKTRPAGLLGRVQWRRRKQRQPLRLAARSTNLELFEQQRRRHHRRRQAAIPTRRAKRTERRAREAGNQALHVVVNVIVVADSREITQRTRIHTDDPGAANHLLAPIFGIDLVHQQRQSIARSRTAAIACEQLLEILLMQQ